MDITQLRQLAATIKERKDSVTSEEATKTALILPFIATLGYDVFNPHEVTPEVHADVGIRKGEKVDYAILKDGKPVILIECKPQDVSLNDVHMGQLHRYFQNTEARFGVLTNGIIYRFFTDLEKPNIMDSTHFFEFNVLNFKDRDVEELKKFAKASFEVENILASASNLRYTQQFVSILASEVQSPSDDFVYYFASKTYDGKITKNVIADFRPILHKALRQFIADQMADRLKTAFGNESKEDTVVQTSDTSAEEPEEGELSTAQTTEAELEAFYIIRAIVREVIAVSDVVMRDVQTYCGILYKDNNRMPICRLWFNRSQKYIGLFDEEKKETRQPIDTVDEIYQYANELKATVVRYIESD